MAVYCAVCMWTIHSEIINQGEWPMQTCMIVEMGQWVSLEVTLSHKIYQCQRLRQAYATSHTFYQVLCGGKWVFLLLCNTNREFCESWSHAPFCFVCWKRSPSYDLPLSTSTRLTGGSTPITYLLTDLLSYYYMKESIYWSLQCVLLWVCVVDSCLVSSLVCLLIPVEVVWWSQ